MREVREGMKGEGEMGFEQGQGEGIGDTFNPALDWEMYNAEEQSSSRTML